MNAQEKNALMDAAKASMNTAIALVIGEVFSGLVAAPALLLAAAELIRATGEDEEAGEAQQRAAECAGILAIPWPFIYIASNAWIGAVAQLRDSLPQFIDLEPVRTKQRAPRERVTREAQARANWDALSSTQRSALEEAAISAESLIHLAPNKRQNDGASSHPVAQARK
jgi:hypothetical protein